MIGLLLTVLLVQGTFAAPENGRVTGIVRTAEGKPAAAVRVAAAVSLPDSVGAGTSLVSLGETDSDGRFVLESIPSGSYHIIAGRLDRPTYYPGTLDPAGGTALTVTSGAALSNINFVIAEESLRPAAGQRSAPNNLEILIPVSVTVEGGGTLPASSPSPGPRVRLVPVAGGKNLETSLSSTRISIPVKANVEEYHVGVENLPNGYRVKSITFGSTDLTGGTLKASIAELSGAAPRVVTYTGEGELQRLIDDIIRRRYGKTLSITLTNN